jgi:hypothetical protein
MSQVNPFSINLFKEFAMARIAQPGYFRISGARPQSDAASRTAASQPVEESKTLAGFLLAAALASLLVVADQVISTWSDGHLLAGWVALWTVAFAALAFLASPLRALSTQASKGMARWWVAKQERRRDEHLWDLARLDPRVMADLHAAMTRING